MGRRLVWDSLWKVSLSPLRDDLVEARGCLDHVHIQPVLGLAEAKDFIRNMERQRLVRPETSALAKMATTSSAFGYTDKSEM